MLFSSDVKRLMSGTMTTPTGKVNEPETQKSSDEECVDMNVDSDIGSHTELINI